MDRMPPVNFYPYLEPVQPSYEGFPGIYYTSLPPYMYFMPPPYFNGVPLAQSVPLINQQTKPLLPRLPAAQILETYAQEEPKEEVRRTHTQQKLKQKQPKPVRKPLRKVQIRPERSALTNIGNQLLTYLYIQKKNNRVIRRLFPDITDDELLSYYEFARKLKECMYGYFNQEKLKKLWHSEPSSEKDRLSYEIVRKLSFYYLEHLLVLAIMTSKKMPVSVKPLHLHIRRKMALFFRDRTTQCYV